MERGYKNIGKLDRQEQKVGQGNEKLSEDLAQNRSNGETKFM